MSVASIILTLCGFLIGFLITQLLILRTKLERYKPVVPHIEVQEGKNYIVLETVTRNITMYAADEMLNGDIRTALDIAVINENVGPVHRMQQSPHTTAVIGVYKLYECKNYGMVASNTKDRKHDEELEELLNGNQEAIITFANKYGITINKNKLSIRENLN